MFLTRLIVIVLLSAALGACGEDAPETSAVPNEAPASTAQNPADGANPACPLS